MSKVRSTTRLTRSGGSSVVKGSSERAEIAVLTCEMGLERERGREGQSGRAVPFLIRRPRASQGILGILACRSVLLNPLRLVTLVSHQKDFIGPTEHPRLSNAVWSGLQGPAAMRAREAEAAGETCGAKPPERTFAWGTEYLGRYLYIRGGVFVRTCRYLGMFR